MASCLEMRPKNLLVYDIHTLAISNYFPIIIPPVSEFAISLSNKLHTTYLNTTRGGAEINHYY